MSRSVWGLQAGLIYTGSGERNTRENKRECVFIINLLTQQQRRPANQTLEVVNAVDVHCLRHSVAVVVQPLLGNSCGPDVIADERHVVLFPILLEYIPVAFVVVLANALEKSIELVTTTDIGACGRVWHHPDKTVLGVVGSSDETDGWVAGDVQLVTDAAQGL